MVLDRHNILNTNQGDSTELLNPNQVINSMIELRIQLAELEQQILALQPAFGNVLHILMRQLDW